MIPVAQNTRATESYNLGETVKMSINADAKVFKIMVSSIYSEKEKTVVRELMANAFDAHIAAGITDRAIEVHLPTTFEPSLIVRDYGVGMEHDFIMTLYNVMGLSTKDKSNGETGMFGVGSKSPLAICDTFTVRAFDDNGIRMYTVGIPDDGVPQISHTFSVYAEGEVYERGIEVIVPVRPEDRARILDGLANQHFSWFDKPVKFVGAHDEIKHKFYKSILKITDNMYVAAPNNKYSGDWNVYIRQGAAVYPLNRSQIMSKLSQDELSALVTLSTKRHIMIDVPIGTADVTVAREHIAYDERSTTNLAAFIKTELKAYGERLAEVVGDAHTFSDALDRMVEEFGNVEVDSGENEYVKKVTLSPLLPLVRKLVENNYLAMHGALPNIEVMRENIDPLDDTKTIQFKTLERPRYYTPGVTFSLTNKDFPEGKVLLHTGTIAPSYNGHTVVSFNSGSVVKLKFSLPHIVYVIPSHLKEWQDKIKVHSRKLVGESIPESTSLDICVIRCARRNRDDVVATLKNHGVVTKVFGIEEFPEAEKDLVAQRNFSKTSAYRMNSSGFDDVKSEPDYTQPAYFVARMGIQHDVVLTHPKDVSKSVGMCSKAAEYTFCSAVVDARRYKLIRDDIPVYRVTEKQAERICGNNPNWIHLPTELAGIMTKEAAGANLERVLCDHSISRLGSFGNFGKHVDRLVSASKNSNHVTTRMRNFSKLVAIMLDNDELMGYALGAAWSKATSNKMFIIQDGLTLSRLSTIHYMLFGKYIDREAFTSRFEKLESLFTSRYKYVDVLLSQHHYDIISEHDLKHIDLYVKAMYAAKADFDFTFDAAPYSDLSVYADIFKTDIRKLSLDPIKEEDEDDDLDSEAA